MWLKHKYTLLKALATALAVALLLYSYGMIDAVREKTDPTVLGKYILSIVACVMWTFLMPTLFESIDEREIRHFYKENES